jgi:hypothetical protein
MLIDMAGIGFSANSSPLSTNIKDYKRIEIALTENYSNFNATFPHRSFGEASQN